MKTKIPLLLLCFLLFYYFDNLTAIFKGLERQKDVIGALKIIFNPLKSSFFVFALDAVLTYLLFYKLYPTKGTIITILVYLMIGLPIMIGMRFLIEEVILFGITGHHNYNMNNLTPKIYILDNIYFTLYFNMMAIVFFGVQYERFSKMSKQALELQVRNSELSFLKSQINPHFLFNNLNSIYTLVYHQSENALPAISKLSELLRYMLYQKEDLVLLSKEIGYLRNFIDLQLMRYDFAPQLKLNIQENIEDTIPIIPLSLIPFVENAFKHGDLRDETSPLCIDLAVKENWLYFKVTNKKNNMHKDETGGIGLENVKKRLELLMAGSFDLEIHDSKEIFIVALKMKIHE